MSSSQKAKKAAKDKKKLREKEAKVRTQMQRWIARVNDMFVVRGVSCPVLCGERRVHKERQKQAAAVAEVRGMMRDRKESMTQPYIVPLQHSFDSRGT
jgi:hypothetical protein